MTHRAYRKQETNNVEHRASYRRRVERVIQRLVVAKESPFVWFAEQEEQQHRGAH